MRSPVGRPLLTFSRTSHLLLCVQFTPSAACLLCAPLARAQSSAAVAADAAISADFAADNGQSYFSQSWLTDTMERRTAASIADVPRVFYQYYVVPDNPTHNSALSRNQMYRDFAVGRRQGTW